MTKIDATEIFTGEFQAGLNEALNNLDKNQFLTRLWAHDHTLWNKSPDEITNRLDWLKLPESMMEHLEEINTFVNAAIEDGFTSALLLGMGGSSLAPDVFQRIFGTKKDYIDVKVLDTTDADLVANVASQLDLAHTLFIVSTKSGGTVETLSLFKYFYNLIADKFGKGHAGKHFIAITDPGSSLQSLAEEYRFRKTFINNPNIGGRYSALSFFGLVPAALLGIRLEKLLSNAAATAYSNRKDLHAFESQAVVIGTLIGIAANHKRDKLTLLTHPALSSVEDWIEQLIAESTGKAGKGILLVAGEKLAGDLSDYSTDRVFVLTEFQDSQVFSQTGEKLRKSGHPVITLRLNSKHSLSSLMLTWEIATAVAGYIIQIHPFNQPNVESAKKLAQSSVQTYKETGHLPESESFPLTPEHLLEFLSTAKQGDYIALQAFTPPSAEADAAFRDLQATLRDRFKLPVTFGFGPRFLHSTGQLHKGDAGNGLFIQFRNTARQDLPIPEKAGEQDSFITFDVLKNAQAIGDAQALLAAKRHLVVFDLGIDPTSKIIDLTKELK